MSFFTFNGSERQLGRFGLVAPGTVLDLTEAEALSVRGNADFVARGTAQLVKTVAATATPEKISATDLFFRRATFTGFKAVRVPNVGTVHYGTSSANDSQPGELTPSDLIEIQAPPGEVYNFADWWVDVLNAGDGLVIFYS